MIGMNDDPMMMMMTDDDDDDDDIFAKDDIYIYKACRVFKGMRNRLLP